MKGRKKIMILILVIGVVVCFSGIYFFLSRYFFYNKNNIYAQRAVLDQLSKRYHQEFELLSTEFETKEVEIGGAAYVHTWTFIVQDEQGKQFNAYVRLYGLVEKGDGNFNSLDYSTYVDDTYGQVLQELQD